MSAIPTLRYNGFHDDWQKTTLSKVSTKVTDGTHATPKPTLRGIPFITAVHVKDGNIDFDGCYYLPKEVHQEIYKRCNPELGDLLMVNIGAGTAISARVKVNFAFSMKNVALVKPDRSKIDDRLLEQIQRKNSKRLKHQLSSGGAQPFLSLKEIGKLKLTIPSLSEQKKIADFLGAVDDKIAGLRERERLLTQYKKGVMQKFFTQTIRFKADDGSDFPDWEKAKLGSYATFKKGKGISKADITVDGLSKCIRYGELYTTYDEVIDIVVSRTNQLVENSVISKPNDLLMPTSDVTPNGLATASALNEEGVILGGDILVMRSESILNRFFAYWVSANKKVVMRLVSGSTVFHLYGSDMEKIDMRVPQWEEQQKIADFLSAIDDKITTVSAQITQMQDFKKGLLQQMFV